MNGFIKDLLELVELMNWRRPVGLLYLEGGGVVLALHLGHLHQLGRAFNSVGENYTIKGIVS